VAGGVITRESQDITWTYTMAACCCSTVSLRGVREAAAGRPIHSPKVLASEKKVAKIRINSGNGSLTFFIN
jgi:hypothetical protein